MSDYMKSTAKATRAALQQRGLTFDQLTHDQQVRYADAMRVPITELNAELAKLERDRPTKFKRGAIVTMSSRGDVVKVQSEPDWPEYLRGQANDPSIWAQVVVLEEKLGLKKRTGSRCERYARVTRKLEKFRQREIKDPQSDADYEGVRRLTKRLQAAEDRYSAREREKAEALGSLDRQARAVRGAAQLAGR